MVRRVDVLQPDMRDALSRLKNSIAVVIDILRASTTIVTALESGCKEIIPAVEIGDALQIAASQPPGNVLLCGERNGRKIQGFDLGNSPLEYSSDHVAGCSLVLTTSNGTLALERASKARQVFVLSFLNFKAVSDLICENARDVFIFCSGTNGSESLEDSVCAGMLCEKIQSASQESVIFNRAAKDTIRLAREHQNDLAAMLKKSKHGSFLVNDGFAADLEICAELNACTVVPVFEDGIIHKKCEKPLHAKSAMDKTQISK